MSPEGSRLFSFAGRILSRPAMRPVTRTSSNLHAALYRLTGGAVQSPHYPTMLLTVTGRRTGKPRTVPLIYLEDGQRLVIAAAYAGSDANPALRVHAALAEPGERADLWRRLVDMYPYFAEYQTRTQREIPVIVLTPA